MSLNHRQITVALHTLGCRSNQAQADQIKEKLAELGFHLVPFKNKADIYIINSCTVTHIADRKSRIFLKKAHQQNPQALIILTSCYAKGIKTSFNFKIENIADIYAIPGFLTGLFPHFPPFPPLHYRYCRGIPLCGTSYPYLSPIRQNLLVQTGCENFCSFCIVPYVKGKFKSRAIDEIIADAKNKIKNGAKELVLTGTNLGAFGKDSQEKLEGLVGQLAKLPLKRIRLSSFEPIYITAKLIKALKKNPKVCPILHLPLQSGDNEILKKMERKYTAKDYEEIIGKIKKLWPPAVFSTDIIVGFPGETQEQFQNTLNLIKKIGFVRVHIFSYSKRAKTKAASLPNLSPQIIRKRYLTAKKFCQQIEQEYANKKIGQMAEILVEQKNAHGLWEGLTKDYLRIAFKSRKNLLGQLVKIKYQ